MSAASHEFAAEVEADLDIARALVAAGIPVFCARPSTTNATGFALPSGWQSMVPDLAEVDRWQQGWALCAVMGTVLDLLDVDPRHSGDISRAGLVDAGLWPRAFGVAATPSGGTHEFISPLGVGSRDGFRAGLDHKGGKPDGSSRGFAFLPPTVRASKCTGELLKYHWTTVPDLEALAEGDDTGVGIAEIIVNTKASTAKATDVPEVDDCGHSGVIIEGRRRQQLLAYAGRLRHRGLSRAEAEILMRVRWADCEQPPAATHPMPCGDALGLLTDVYSRYRAGAVDVAVDAWLAATLTTTPEASEAAAVPGATVPPRRRVVATSAATISPRRVFWLWHHRIALGTLALIAGPEGLGKSTVAYWLAAQVTRGTLPGEFSGQPRGVLIAASEDSWPITIVPRLIAAGADLDKVWRVETVIYDDLHMPLTLPKDVDGLRQVAIDNDVALLILDPLTSRVDDKLDTHRDAETRRALEPLAALADDANLAIVGLIHHNKSSTTDPLNLVMASKAFTAVARSVHTIIRDPEDESGQARLLGTSKNNLGSTDLPVLRFVIDSHTLPTQDGPASTGKVRWTEDAAGTIGDAVRRGVESAGDRTAVAEAVDWLRDYMVTQGGQVASADAKKAGAKAGHTDDALKRARLKLALTIKSIGFPRSTIWCDPQPEQAEPQSGDHSQVPVWGESLKHLTAYVSPPLAQSVQLVQSGDTGDGLPPLSGWEWPADSIGAPA